MTVVGPSFGASSSGGRRPVAPREVLGVAQRRVFASSGGRQVVGRTARPEVARATSSIQHHTPLSHLPLAKSWGRRLENREWIVLATIRYGMIYEKCAHDG